jgi:multidrug resistance efflux pump
VKIPRNYLATGTVVLIAILAVALKYWDYLVNPWTRDGQVRAEVVQIAPRVSGPIVELAVKDNQYVKAGELLFVIDPRTFKASLDQARARYDLTVDSYSAKEKQVQAAEARIGVAQASVEQAQSAIAAADAAVENARSEYQRQQELIKDRATSQKSVEGAKARYEVSVQKRLGAIGSLAQARASLAQSEADLAEARANLGAAGDDNASIREARAALEQAELNLEFTRVTAPVDGYVTNLNLRLGSQIVANQPSLALVDANSFWVQAFFRETSIEGIDSGDRAIVTLMAYSDKPIEGRVDSLGWGIASQNGTTGFELLPNVSPTFEWIRLAQRVPVRVHLGVLPDGVALRAGMTGSVLVMTGKSADGNVAAIPTALQ